MLELIKHNAGYEIFAVGEGIITHFGQIVRQGDLAQGTVLKRIGPDRRDGVGKNDFRAIVHAESGGGNGADVSPVVDRRDLQYRIGGLPLRYLLGALLQKF